MNTDLIRLREGLSYFFDLFSTLSTHAEFTINLMKRIDGVYKIELGYLCELNTENLLWNLYSELFSITTNIKPAPELKQHIEFHLIENLVEKHFRLSSYLLEEAIYESPTYRPFPGEFLEPKISQIHTYSANLIEAILFAQINSHDVDDRKLLGVTSLNIDHTHKCMSMLSHRYLVMANGKIGKVPIDNAIKFLVSEWGQPVRGIFHDIHKSILEEKRQAGLEAYHQFNPSKILALMLISFS